MRFKSGYPYKFDHLPLADCFQHDTKAPPSNFDPPKQLQPQHTDAFSHHHDHQTKVTSTDIVPLARNIKLLTSLELCTKRVCKQDLYELLSHLFQLGTRSSVDACFG